MKSEERNQILTLTEMMIVVEVHPKRIARLFESHPVPINRDLNTKF